MYLGELTEKGANYQAGYFKALDNLQEAILSKATVLANAKDPTRIRLIIEKIYEEEVEFAEEFGMADPTIE